ncbi:MAG: glycosyltransferase family 39 protein [Acidobacteria bacterium]|nr:glycosyltransferase family 39 protein [Acidobacteriota bacterium]
MSETAGVMAIRPSSFIMRIWNWAAHASELQLFCAMYAVAFAVRLGAALLIGTHRLPEEGDQLNYFRSAIALIERHGFYHFWRDGVLRPTAGQMPGTSAFVALGVLLFGKHHESARLIAVIISSFSAPLLYLFTRKIASRTVAIVAGLACAFYPTWVFYSSDVLSEPFFLPLMILSMLLTARAFRSDNDWSGLAAGLSWGLTTMVRPHGAPMALFVAMYLLWRRGWRRALLVSFGVALLVGPWLLRNYRLYGFPFLATESAETFLGSNNPFVVETPLLHGMWIAPWAIPEYRAKIEFVYDDMQRVKIQNDIAWAYLKQNPKVVPVLAFRKLKRWLTPITHSGGATRLMVLASYGTLLLLLGLGVVRRLYRRSVELELIIVWSLLLAAITAVYWGNLTRGRLPLELLWLPWGSLAAVDLVNWCATYLKRKLAANHSSETAPFERNTAA